MNNTTRRQGLSEPQATAGSALTRAGEMVGPYVLIELLGRGGLGEVWLARRGAGEYTPEVAIKLIPGRDLGDPELARRFDRERRILAQLDHPNIARLLDAGRFGPGWPYLVMERVDGLPLDQAVQPLELSQRLQLFIRVCRAVQFAHRRLVIHRDIKPANILVSSDGEPHLLDFNTAKLLEADDDPELTRGAAPFTAQYASPEQVRAESLTTASDGYSLGVMLYELIVDRNPYGEMTTSNYALGRAICETRPAPPSALGRGDHWLDAIVERAMHKNPDRRYRSVDGLADDVQAWLDRRPIKARPVGRLERAALLLRRHPASSLIVGSLVALVLGATGLFFWQMQEARAERDVAFAVTGFLERLFEAADPGSTEFSGDDLFAILDDRTQALVEQPPGDPRIAARLLASLGTVQANFGRLEPASALFKRSYDANPDLEILVRWANARLELGDNDGAAALFEQAHERRATMSPEMQAFHGASYAQLEVLRGQLDAARRFAEEAARVAPAGSVDEVYAVDTLAQVLFHSGDVEAAARVGQQALNVAIDYYGDPHLQVSTSRNNLALFLGRLGQDEQALALLEQAVEDVTELLGPDDPRLTVSLSNLANRRSDQGQLSAAIEAHDQALRLTRQHYGESHPTFGLIQGNRALTLMRQGALLEAESEFRAALALLDETPLYRVRVGLAATGNRVLLGQLEQAEALLDVVSDDVNQLYPTDHARHGSVLELRTLIALESNNAEEANRLLALLDRFDAADTASLRLLQVQAAAQAGDCDSAVSVWAAVDPAAEIKKAALYRAASSVLSSGCD